MKGSDKIASIVIVFALIGVVGLKFFQLEFSWEVIVGIFAFLSISAFVYFRNSQKKDRQDG
jgi:hypothetical protein